MAFTSNKHVRTELICQIAFLGLEVAELSAVAAVISVHHFV